MMLLGGFLLGQLDNFQGFRVATGYCGHQVRGTTKEAPMQATRKAWMSICRKEDLDLEPTFIKPSRSSHGPKGQSPVTWRYDYIIIINYIDHYEIILE